MFFVPLSQVRALALHEGMEATFLLRRIVAIARSPIWVLLVGHRCYLCPYRKAMYTAALFRTRGTE